MKLQELLMTKSVLGWQHLLNGVFNQTSRVVLQQVASDFMLQTTWMLAVTVVDLVRGFFAS